MRPFEGVRVLDLTHVLAGPFATYQLALLGADVIKIEPPDEPDQTRNIGADKALNAANMGTFYLAQASNKRSITLNLKTEQGREILRKLVARADVMVENYRPGALAALGLGADDDDGAQSAADLRVDVGVRPGRPARHADRLRHEHPGQLRHHGDDRHRDGRRRSCSGRRRSITPAAPPGAFALASALFQRERTGRGQRIDLAMIDVAMTLMGSHLASYLRNGALPKPRGNRHEMATNGGYETKDGYLVMGAQQSAPGQAAYGRCSDGRNSSRRRCRSGATIASRRPKALAEILMTRTAAEWEELFQANHMPAARVRTLAEAVADPQIATRGIVHRYDVGARHRGRIRRAGRAVQVRAAADRRSTRRRRSMGEDTEAVLGELGYRQLPRSSGCAPPR